MSAPPVPPRPLSPPRTESHRPPLPPLPPNFRPEIDGVKESPPHFADPLVAPRPQKLMSSVPADMARNLEQQMDNYPPQQPAYPVLQPPMAPDAYRRQSPAPPPHAQAYQGAYPPAGFFPPASARVGPSPAPPVPYPAPFFGGAPQPQKPWTPAPPQPNAGGWQPPQPGYASPQPPAWNPHSPAPPPTWNPPPPVQQSQWPPAPTSPPIPPAFHHQPSHSQSLASSMASLSFADPAPPLPPRVQSPGIPPSLPGQPPALTATFPTVQTLTAAMASTISSPDPARKVAWAKDVFTLYDKTLQIAGITPSNPEAVAAYVPEPGLTRLTDSAVQFILTLTSPPLPSPLPSHIAEAVYLRGTLLSTGAFPVFLPHNPRDSFRDFETAARAGFAQGWFKLGRDYENVGDTGRAKDCYERGIRANVGSCFYRLGMAHLQGQMGLTANPSTAMPLIQRAASLANTEMPQPAYVYSLIVLGEFPQITLPPGLLASILPTTTQNQSIEARIQAESRKYLERAAYLGFAPAQFKLGHAYEYATPPFPYDPLMSVQYYSLASQGGEVEADMALSKWFLCGAEGGAEGGGFDKDESLAYVFAEKAAKKGLPSAEFALGYYAEVGVGPTGKNLEAAKKWYGKAAEHGNAEAPARLRALSQAKPAPLSRVEHESLTDANLTRRRTQAKISSAAAGRKPVSQGQMMPTVVEQVRRVGQEPAYGGPGAQPRPRPQGSQGAQGSQSVVTPPHRDSSLAGGLHGAGGPHGPAGPHGAAGPGPGGPGRYSVALADSGPAPGGPPPPIGGGGGNAGSKPNSRPGTGQGAGGRPFGAGGGPGGGGGGRPSAPQSASSSAPSSPPTQSHKPAGPATFAEMGYTSHKLDEKECRIM